MEIVLNTYGAALAKENGGFVISGPDGKHHIPAEGITSIRVANGASITSDAILFAVDEEIEIVFSDKSGFPKGRVWSPKYGSISTIRKGQVTFTSSSDAVSWIRNVLISKVENQQAMIQMMAQDNEQQRITSAAGHISRLERFRAKIASINGGNVKEVAPELRGLEGAASRIYFRAYSSFLPETARFGERSQHPAKDPANALLNYGYGMLYGKIEGAMICAGIDPYIGVLHRDEYNRPVLVYDVIELYRVWVEYVVYRILQSGVLKEDFCSFQEDGAVRLEALGRKVIIQSLNDYLEEIIDDGKKTRSRSTMIDLYAQELAQYFKKHY